MSEGSPWRQGAGGICLVCNPGLVEYGEALKFQRRIHRLRVAGEIPDVLLLLEHLPTITLGKAGSSSNILLSPERLSELGISLFYIERGGDATYHGPGQLVGYPIIDLKNRGSDIRTFVTVLEEVMIRTAADFSIDGVRDPGHRGVWVEKEELGRSGISVRKWVTMHGFALNVTTDLDHFAFINPCGFTDRHATSFARCLSAEADLKSVTERLQYHFSSIFGVELVTTTKEELHRLFPIEDP